MKPTLPGPDDCIAGANQRFVHDAAGRLVRTTRPDGAATTFGHDAHGNLTSVTPPERSPHRLGYSPVDLLTSYTPPAVDGQVNPFCATTTQTAGSAA